ncbi:DUF2500 domain-containing protein [Sporolactobacillus terrae]|uniref:DUF2500 domain-containing protein n=1 Tax=Sporolactobacillus terrae TaxID=269673 RepID=UPI001E393A75|nr:DUF2500 domain-containing protein [Sporolactobacillus terrae]
MVKEPEATGGNERPVITHYYATVEVESGDRIEFEVSGLEYGMLDFQGTRYLGYQRSLEP